MPKKYAPGATVVVLGRAAHNGPVVELAATYGRKVGKVHYVTLREGYRAGRVHEVLDTMIRVPAAFEVIA